MQMQTQTVKFTTRELRVTREMSPEEFVRSVRGGVTAIARRAKVSHQAVSAVLRGKKRSARITREIRRWINQQIERIEEAA